MIDRDGRRAGRLLARVIVPLALAGAVGGLLTPVALAESAPAHTAVDLTLTDYPQLGDATARHVLASVNVRDVGPDGICRRLVALPECDGASVERVVALDCAGESGTLSSAAAELAWVEQVARIRDQVVAVVAIDVERLQDRLTSTGIGEDFEVVVSPQNARGSALRNAGPFTRVLERSVMNYGGPDIAAVWTPPSGPAAPPAGTATYCGSVQDCAQAGIDVLLIVADQLHSSPLVQVYANYLASYLGLNVGVVGTSALAELTPLALHDFIQDVYWTQSAAHFGDGHLGFVTLIGDAYADDNVTAMVPEYDGYGGNQEASDHYYACVSGDDDFEDVMIGRLSVGNSSELAAVIAKTANYAPLPQDEPWTKSILMVAGMFYTIKDDYVALFDEYEELIPDDWNVDRIYRHDFPNNHQCSLAVVDSIDDGHMFINFAGDGWISTWYMVLDNTDIPRLQNDGRFPVVLSMACMTGWFDNVTDIGPDGSYDCLAEQFVNADNKGAIACLAASRTSDGGIFRTFTKEIYRAAFEEHCAFLGETFAVAKLLHIQDGGTVTYARHFNLLGESALAYRWYEAPDSKPELVIRPHELIISPDLPGVGEELSVDVTVRNLSAVPVPDVLLRVTDVSAEGTYTADQVIPLIDDWSSETVSVLIPALCGGWHTVSAAVDPDEDVEEIDESNNVASTAVYAYPHAPGFPTNSGSDPYGPCIASLEDGQAHVVLMESEARVRAIDQDGQTCWLSDPASDPVDYGPEITPAVGDLDGDGQNEIVAVRRMGLAAFDEDGNSRWQILTDDPVGAPVLADADADGDLDVILATKMFFGGTSHVVAFDEDGGVIWSFAAPDGDPVSATPVVGDFNQDGVVDFCYGTQDGMVEAASCAENPPSKLWGPTAISSEPIHMLALADLDDDGVLEVAAGGDALYCLNAEDGSEDWNVATDGGVVALALGDVDRDGVLDVVIGTATATLADIENGTSVWETDLPGVPYWSPAIAEVIDDDQNEICVVTDDGSLSIINRFGASVVDPVPVPDAFGSPFVADLGGGAGLEVCVASSAGQLFAFAFDQESDEPFLEWMGPGGDERHSGLLCQPFAGSFSGDAVLQGDYLITGDVTVAESATLFVSPGTVIEFDDDASPILDIWGSLQANGTPQAPVVMTSSGSRGRAGSWDGIKFRPGSTASLEACQISAAEIALRGNQAIVNMDGCELFDSTYGAYLTGCTLNAQGSVFADCDSTGMYLSGGGGTIHDCVFDGNVLSGLWISDYATDHVSGCTFTGTSSGSGLICYRFSNVTVDSCTIANNAHHGALVHNAAADFNACTITGNSKNGIHSRKLAELIVRSCTITGNRIGVTAETGAVPNIGLGDGLQPAAGFNSIYGNQVAAVANYNTNTELPLSARENWWGTYPPNGRIFIGYVRYVPCLEAPPEQAPARPAGVADPDPAPFTLQLGRCVPNPFRVDTAVRYEIPAGSGHVEISVFDVAGRRVATLYSGHQEPGTHSVTWDGRDRFGNRVATGIYFVRLESSDVRATAKMVLLR